MLEVKDLSVTYPGVKAVNDVSLAVRPGEVLGLVGESGSGKSTIALAIMRLIAPPGRITAGKVLLAGRDLMTLPADEMIKVRGAQISMIFQDPFTSLNPVFTVGEQIAEAVRLHQGLKKRAAWEKAVGMLDLVRIKDPGSRSKDYPHQFSGGMRQRVMIAMALACQPGLLIADEPTTALDVTVQAEILRLLQELQAKLGLSIIYITHNFGIVREICGRVVVLHQGSVVEEGETAAIFNAPRNAYTQRLIESLRIISGR